MFVQLQNRGLVQIEGEDRYDFLQNLVSNDVSLLKTQRCVYACLLTAQGKFLHDFFMLEGDGVILLDCEGGARAQDLYRRLNLYRLRAKVKISVEENHPVFAVFSASPPAGAWPDPRHWQMGSRVFEKPEGLEEKPFGEWDRQRILLAVPDGSRDMAPEQSTLIECGIDRVNGVSFEKGCYVGQELTARMHHRGLAKKRLYAVKGELPEPGAEILAADGKPIGEMRSRCGNLGLALLRGDSLEKLAPPLVLC